MLVPVISKVLSSSGVLTERVLPVPGEILVTKGTKVVPYDHLGICTFSQKLLKLSHKFKPVDFKKDGQFYYCNSVLGREGRTKVDAPYNGNLHKINNGSYEFREEPKRYTLLSGVWGTVEEVLEKESVLIKAQTKDINLSVATKTIFAGELVVFPNPIHLLEKFYLEGFAGGASDGKIVYVGNNVSMQFLKDAVKYGLGGVIGGSADREVFRYAQEAGISFGLFGGFGDIHTPDDIYTILNNVPNRYVFFQGERNLLRIPMPPEENVGSIESQKPAALAEVKAGDRVLVLQRPYFGKTGVVDRVSQSSIFVRFSLNESPVEVMLPNFFLLNSF